MERKRCYGCMRLKTSSPICEYCGYDENTPNAPHQLPAGTVLKEQYLVGRVLGQGGFGITYLGWDLYLDIPVAVKEYYPSGAVMRETSVTMDVISYDGETGNRFANNKERFMREAKMLARFSQVPEIVQVKNFFLANNTAYIVMEYVEGITLKQYVKDHGGKLSVEETLTILGPVVEALCKVHKAGLVHRDISPDNIMMLPQGGAKLLDFGAVRDVGAASVDKGLTKSTEAILKQGYAPIEQYQKRGSLGPWTDVYALCATMYYCMTGHVPPDAPERLLGDEDLELRKRIPGLTASQEAALEHGMALRAEKRTNSMEVLHEELFRKEDAPPVTELTEDPPPPPPHVKIPHVSKEHREKGKKTAEQKQETSHTDEKPSEPGEKTSQDSEEGSGEDSGQETGKALAGKGRMILIGVLGAAAVLLVCLILVLGGRSKEDAALPTEGDGNTISGNCGLDLTWVLDKNTGALTISGSGKMYDYRWDGYYELTGLIAPWNSYRDQITSVTMEDGVTVVGACAFAGCENLKTVSLPGTLVEIRHNAFDMCALTELTLPDGLETIGESAFSWSPLATLTIPDSVIYVDRAAFDCNDQLESVTIGPDTRLNYDTWYPIFSGNGFTIYGYTNSMAEDYAQILGCNFVSTGENQWDAQGQCGDNLNWYLDLDTGFLKIDGEGQMLDFNGTWQLEEKNKDAWNDDLELPPWSKYRGKVYVVSIADGVTSIGSNAFENCDNLVDVSFGNTLETIGYQSFLGTAVDEIALPNSVTDIDSFAFNWCENLTEVRLPENLELLKENAIAECGNLQSLFVGRDTVIDESHGMPFTSDGNGLSTTYPHLTIYGLQNSDAERFAKEYGFSFTIGAWPEPWAWARLIAEAQGQCGDDVWWFLGNEMDTLVVYGTGGMWDFNGTWQLREENQDEWLDNRELPPWSDYQDQIKNLFFLGNVTYIGENAFSGCNLSGTVDLGSSVRTIGGMAFLESGICEIAIPDSVTSIEYSAFNWCESLTRVWLSDNLKKLQAGVFNQCRYLQKLYVGGNTTVESDGELTPFTQLGAMQDETTMPYNLTIYGYENSDAQRFAQEYDIPFVPAPAE